MKADIVLTLRDEVVAKPVDRDRARVLFKVAGDPISGHLCQAHAQGAASGVSASAVLLQCDAL